MAENRSDKQIKKREQKKAWTKKKIIAVSILGTSVVAAIIFAIIVIVNGLGRVRPIKSTEQEATVVGSVAGYEVRYEELRYITLACKAELENELGKYEQLDSAAKTEYENELKERVLARLEENYAVLSLAEEYGIKTDSLKVQREVQSIIEKFVAENCGDSVNTYKSELAARNMTDSLFRLVYKVDYIEELLLEKLIEDGDKIIYSADDPDSVVAFTEYVVNSGEYARTIHVFYPKTSQYVDTSNSRERAEAIAKELLAESDANERYSLMCSAIGAAPFVPGISMTNDGVYFTYNQMGEAYESATFALEYFGTSGVVETADGYFVIMRLEPELDAVRKRVNDLLRQYQYAVLYSLENQQKDKIEFIPNEYFESISLIDVK